MDERRRKALKTLLGVGAISSLLGASILTTDLLTRRRVEVIEQIINKTIVQQPINQTQVTEQVQQYNTYTTNYWDSDVVIYTQNGNYYAVSHDGTTICTSSPTSCIQEAMNYLYKTKGGGKIFIKSGYYNVYETIVLPWDDAYNVAIEGEGPYNASNLTTNMGNTTIVLRPPAQILSYNAWLNQQTGTTNYLPYPMLFIRNLGIVVAGGGAGYTNVTTPVVQLYRVWCELENVYLNAVGYFNAQQGFILGMCYGEGPPGVAPVWKNVYLDEGIWGITGSGILRVLYHRSEGFIWEGGGVSLLHTVSGNQLAILDLDAMNTAVLNSIDVFWDSSVVPNNSMYAYIVNSNGYNVIHYRLIGVEMPPKQFLYNGYHIMPLPTVNNVNVELTSTTYPTLIPPPPQGFVRYVGLIRNQSVSVPVGTGGSYGSPAYVDLLMAVIYAIIINVSNVASGETITVNLSFYYSDGTVKTLTKQFTSSTTYQLTPSDIASIAYFPSGAIEPFLWYLQIQASSNLSSTSASVTVQAITM